MSLIKKVPIAAEDCLLDATVTTVSQRRASGIVTVHPLNAETIPYSGVFGESTFVSIKEKIDEALSGGGGGGTDELVKTTSSDPTAGYLYDKVEISQFEVSSNRIRIRDNVLMVGAMNDVDISSRNDGYALVWSASQNQYVHQYISGGGGGGTDELVKADSTDSSAGYLNDKVDSNQFDLDTSGSNHFIKIKNYGQVKFSLLGSWGYFGNFVDNNTIKIDTGNECIYVDNGALRLTNLGDVDAASQADGKFLKWDASANKYVHADAGGSGDSYVHQLITQTDYDNLGTPNSNTIYLIYTP